MALEPRGHHVDGRVVDDDDVAVGVAVLVLIQFVVGLRLRTWKRRLGTSSDFVTLTAWFSAPVRTARMRLMRGSPSGQVGGGLAGL
ncbi:hypothetical protein [Actinomadura rubrisoli]|uniref:Uncharacterized protein n=1 Tax=Actinomadura rubrisoli TaxID=2530368 RepID=A0A4R5C6G5_9ACTN|nr:hypothetical protein [Actinomadura rubrisoli]TDD94136.1 hypothetical protein E1298_07435 [Actinomadura rubrisoli]